MRRNLIFEAGKTKKEDYGSPPALNEFKKEFIQTLIIKKTWKEFNFRHLLSKSKDQTLHWRRSSGLKVYIKSQETGWLAGCRQWEQPRMRRSCAHLRHPESSHTVDMSDTRQRSQSSVQPLTVSHRLDRTRGSELDIWQKLYNQIQRFRSTPTSKHHSASTLAHSYWGEEKTEGSPIKCLSGTPRPRELGGTQEQEEVLVECGSSDFMRETVILLFYFFPWQ